MRKRGRVGGRRAPADTGVPRTSERLAEPLGSSRAGKVSSADRYVPVEAFGNPVAAARRKAERDIDGSDDGDVDLVGLRLVTLQCLECACDRLCHDDLPRTGRILALLAGRRCDPPHDLPQNQRSGVDAPPPPSPNLVVLILAALVLVTVALVHVERLTTTAVNLFVFSTAVAACLTILMVYDAPFAAGGNSVEPTLLRDIGFD